MNIQGKKVLVTGHNGFLGSKLVNRLVRDDAEVVTLTDARGHRIDLRNWEKIQDTFDAVDIIYHLAAVTYVPLSFKNPREVYEVNTMGTLNILELARQRDVEKIVYTSSYVYGKPQYLPIDEHHPVNPFNPYSRSKLLAEQLLEAYNNDFGLECVILRPFNIYGRDQGADFLIPSILEQLEKGQIKLKDCEPRRDFIHVQDVVEALILALNVKKDFDVFNIGNGISYSVKEIVDKIIYLYGKSVEVDCAKEKRKNEVMDTVADITKAREELGWEPRIDINQGLSDVLEGLKR
ncbi:MAG: GDP-mannose 4,6-dehydratase [Methanobacterium sp.]|nr:GDP-mannose 4,6-dehydratase [Methanobacterium sp.]